MVRPPFSKRRDDASITDFFVLRDGVPDGLLSSMVPFVTERMYGTDVFNKSVPKEPLIAAFARVTDTYLPNHASSAADRLADDRELLLDAVDFVLGSVVTDEYEGAYKAADLESHLQESRSIYTIGRDGDGRYELQERQPAELTRLVEDATRATDRAAEHLRRAWSKAFARKPDPNGACDEAVKAVEAAARPLTGTAVAADT